MECEIPSIGREETYEQLKAGMGAQSYWVRFFMRPCCPPPGNDVAKSMTEHLKADIDARDDFTESERADLKNIVDERLAWYLTLPVRHMA